MRSLLFLVGLTLIFAQSETPTVTSTATPSQSTTPAPSNSPTASTSQISITGAPSSNSTSAPSTATSSPTPAPVFGNCSAHTSCSSCLDANEAGVACQWCPPQWAPNSTNGTGNCFVPASNTNHLCPNPKVWYCDNSVKADMIAVTTVAVLFSILCFCLCCAVGVSIFIKNRDYWWPRHTSARPGGGFTPIGVTPTAAETRDFRPSVTKEDESLFTTSEK